MTTSLSMASYVQEILYSHKLTIIEKKISESGEITEKQKEVDVYSIDENSLYKYITQQDIYLFIKIINEVIYLVFPKYT